MHYLDFEIRLEALQGQASYGASLLTSPGGQTQTSFHLPVILQNLCQLRANLAHLVLRNWPDSARGNQLLSLLGERVFSAEEIGGALFHCLFSGGIRDLFHQSLGHIANRKNHGLRIKIRSDPVSDDTKINTAALVQVLNLPWEFLYQASTRDFLSRNQLTPIVRYLGVPQPPKPTIVRSRLRLLVVISNPAGTNLLDVERERQAVEAAWTEESKVECRFLTNPTLSHLHETLLGATFHVLHFIGHGIFVETSGTGAIVIADAQGSAVAASGKVLASILTAFPDLRLVFLNACDTGRISEIAGVDLFAGVATSLVLAGLPAVVAMQFPISDAAALAFSKTFYRQLAAGEPIDAAVSQGRMSIYAQNPDSLEWGTPVLFMRSPDGQLFDLAHRIAAPKIRIITTKQRMVAMQMLSEMFDEQFEMVIGELDPERHSVPLSSQHPRPSFRRTHVERLLNLLERRGTHWWIRAQETVLSLSSPLSLLNRPEEEWECAPRTSWQMTHDHLLGMGEDPRTFPEAPYPEIQAASLRIWNGLLFQDALFRARVWFPRHPDGGAAGLILRYIEGHGGLLALLRDVPTGGRHGEIWLMRGGALSLLAAAPLPEQDTDHGYEILFQVDQKTVQLGIGDQPPIKASTNAVLPPGYPGFIKFADVVVRFSECEIKVASRRASQSQLSHDPSHDPNKLRSPSC